MRHPVLNIDNAGFSQSDLVQQQLNNENPNKLILQILLASTKVLMKVS